MFKLARCTFACAARFALLVLANLIGADFRVPPFFVSKLEIC